jgi:hypothetical protein
MAMCETRCQVVYSDSIFRLRLLYECPLTLSYTGATHILRFFQPIEVYP